VVQHHAIQVFVLCVEPHLDVTSEVRVALWSVGLLQLVTQQAGHTLHLHLLLSDEDLHSIFPIAWLFLCESFCLLTFAAHAAEATAADAMYRVQQS